MQRAFRAGVLAVVVLSSVACETTKGSQNDGPGGGGDVVRDDGKEIRLKGENGVLLFTLHGDELRGPGGRVAFVRDGHQIRRGGDDGEPVYWIRGDEVRKRNAKGDVLLRFADHEIRRGPGQDGEVLFVWRGTQVWRGSISGARTLHVDRQMPRWAVVCALHGMY